MGIFDLDHISENPDNFTAGPRVGWGEAISAGFEQQFRVDSPLALEYEVQDAWLQNIQELERLTGETFQQPDNLSDYQNYMRQLAGEPVEWSQATSYEAPEVRLAKFERAQQRIKELGNPAVKSFEEILLDVFKMQQEVEARSADVSARGDWLGQMIGAIGGSFTTRDPLSLYTLTMGGGGRTVAMRIASEMAVAGAVAGASDVAFVNPNRERAGLPERSPLADIGFAALGAGAFRGGIEVGAAGFHRMAPSRSISDIALDFSDDQLRQMFENNLNSARARAGEQLLDDAVFIEQNNPYGVGEAAQARFMAELADVARVIAGEPQTAVARFLPPIPFEMVEKAADFQIVKERSPEVYAKLKAAEAQVAELSDRVNGVGRAVSDDPIFQNELRLNEQSTDIMWMSPQEYQVLALQRRNAVAPRQENVEKLQTRIQEEGLQSTPYLAFDDVGKVIEQEGLHRAAALANLGHTSIPVRLYGNPTQAFSAALRSANRVYNNAFRAVEAERVRLLAEADAFRRAQQAESVDLLSYATNLRPFIAPHLDYDMVAQRVTRITEEDAAIPERANALIQTAPDEDGRLDIGLAEPVDGTFRFATDDGDMSIEDALIDLREDELLEEAMRTCLL